MNSIFSNPLFGIALSILAFSIGLFLNKTLKSPLVNPLLVAIFLVIAVLSVFQIPLSSYQEGGAVISMFLAPATTVLGYSIYHQAKILKKYFWPILAGCLVGSIASMSSVYLLCQLFHLDKKLTASLIPKSVTTPIAMEISGQLNGIQAVTIAVVVITGILGAVLAPVLIKVFRIDNEIAQGIAIGSSSHAVGTSKAVELGEIQGAMSGLAIGISGILTVIISLFF